MQLSVSTFQVAEMLHIISPNYLRKIRIGLEFIYVFVILTDDEGFTMLLRLHNRHMQAGPPCISHEVIVSASILARSETLRHAHFLPDSQIVGTVSGLQGMGSS
jgi:hypothetical protein